MGRKRMILIALGMLMSLAGCGDTQTNDTAGLFREGGDSAAETETKPEVPEGAIVDASGDFVYSGKLQQIGDDENGYIQVPLGFLQFQDIDVEGLTQYSDVTGTNIVTLDFYEGINYQLAADSMLAYVQQDESFVDVQGATVEVAGYHALQLYGRFSDGYLIVVWFIEDPANSSNSYYLAMEFDTDHSYLIACSSTFRTVEDYHASAAE